MSQSQYRSDSRSPSRYKSKLVKPEVVENQTEERLIEPLQMHRLRERNASLRLDLSRSSQKNLVLQSKIKELKDKAKSDRKGMQKDQKHIKFMQRDHQHQSFEQQKAIKRMEVMVRKSQKSLEAHQFILAELLSDK